MTSQEQ